MRIDTPKERDYYRHGGILQYVLRQLAWQQGGLTRKRGPARVHTLMAASTLAIFDLDGTITRHDTMWPFVSGFLLRHPTRWWRLPLCLLPSLKHFLSDRDRGALKSAVLRLTVGGAERAELDRWAARYTRQLLRTGLYEEALEKIATLRKTQARLVLLSASPDLYVPLIARALGFDECICTEVRWARTAGSMARSSPQTAAGRKKRVACASCWQDTSHRCPGLRQ